MTCAPFTRVPQILATHPAGPLLQRITTAVLAALDPEQAIATQLKWDGQTLRVADLSVAVPGRIWVIGAGKASVAMARGLHKLLGDRVAGGCVAAKHAAPDIGPIQVRAAGHPLPDERSTEAAAAAIQLAAQASDDDLIISPISGGASALWVDVAGTDALDRLRAQTDAMLRGHHPIDALNASRSAGDRIKRGGLVTAAAKTPVLGLIVSDVGDRDPSWVGSGPTFAEGVSNHVLLANEDAVAAALEAAVSEGLVPVRASALEGPAAAAGVALCRQLDLEDDRMRCFVAGGETTVEVRGDGLGGRNLEVALAAAPGLMAHPHALLATLATDGEDGPTDAAGAVVSASTIPRALEAGFDPDDSLRRNDSYRLLDALDDLWATGSTMTNVGDLAIMLG